MPAVKLNQRRVDALKPRKSVYDVRDRDLKGFGLRVWPSGKKCYFVHSQHGGRRVWKTIASAESTSAGEARAWAATMTVIELEVAAGEDTPELCEEFKGRVWFRRGWLAQRGLNAEDCIVIGCKGQSMEPTLPDGCSVLVDRSSVECEPSHILMLRTGGGQVVKRAADEAGARIMRSDNPDWPDAPLPEGADIIGRVRWMGYGVD